MKRQPTTRVECGLWDLHVITVYKTKLQVFPHDFPLPAKHPLINLTHVLTSTPGRVYTLTMLWPLLSEMRGWIANHPFTSLSFHPNYIQNPLKQTASSSWCPEKPMQGPIQYTSSENVLNDYMFINRKEAAIGTVDPVYIHRITTHLQQVASDFSFLPINLYMLRPHLKWPLPLITSQRSFTSPSAIIHWHLHEHVCVCVCWF